MPGGRRAATLYRMTTIAPDTTVAELVLARPSLSRVFERLGIDYCCGGKRSLEKACMRSGLDVTTTIALLEAGLADAPANTVDWRQAPATDLIEHIVVHHHGLLREELPRLGAMADRVAQRHGPDDERLVELAQVFAAFRDELEQHMEAEEHVLFPACAALEAAAAGDAGATTRFAFPSVALPISVMEHQHDDAGAALERMRMLTDGYDLDAARCNTHRALVDGLHALEVDMHEHVHEENNILFTRALALEGEARA